MLVVVMLKRASSSKDFCVPLGSARSRDLVINAFFSLLISDLVCNSPTSVTTCFWNSKLFPEVANLCGDDSGRNLRVVRKCIAMEWSSN